MTPLPAVLAPSTGLAAWRLDRARFAQTWDSGEGSFQVGGRWSARGIRAVYCALDPATAILEVAVHKTFRVLDTVPHVLTRLRIDDPTDVHVVQPTDIPNPNWLHPGVPSAGQLDFGSRLLGQHRFLILPSVVSTYSWNLVFRVDLAAGHYSVDFQRPFALDPRLHPPPQDGPTPDSNP